ncbi:unnamed protein product [Larinioides sclopetarius]|uniref:Uncharacterized protein n=1 Tax=Larinioides sclopetarius TaxID=280406 RepID=A0AAV2AWG4_9ARAC
MKSQLDVIYVINRFLIGVF